MTTVTTTVHEPLDFSVIATGLGFAAFTSFWPLALVGMIGTLNPSGGDVSVFLPTEQALLPDTAPNEQRTALGQFSKYRVVVTVIAVAISTGHLWLRCFSLA